MALSSLLAFRQLQIANTVRENWWRRATCAIDYEYFVPDGGEHTLSMVCVPLYSEPATSIDILSPLHKNKRTPQAVPLQRVARGMDMR